MDSHVNKSFTILYNTYNTTHPDIGRALVLQRKSVAATMLQNNGLGLQQYNNIRKCSNTTIQGSSVVLRCNYVVIRGNQFQYTM